MPFCKSKYLIIVFIALLYSSELYSQSLEELKASLSKSKKDTNRVILLRDIAFELSMSNPKEASKYAEECLALSNEIGFQKGIALAYNTFGVINFAKGNYGKAIENYYKSLKINEKIGNKQGIASNFGNIGNAYFRESNFKNAKEYLRKAIPINQELNNKIGLSNNYSNLGLVFLAEKNYNLALQSFNESLKINTESNRISGIAGNQNNIGLVNIELKNYKEALKNFNYAMYGYEMLADSNNLSNVLNNIGEALIKFNKKQLAYDYLKRALDISRRIGAKSLEMNTHKILSQFNEGNDNLKSLYHLKEFYQLRDSIKNFEDQLKLAELNFDYKEEKKNQELKLKDAEISNKNFIIFSSIAGLILLLVLVFIIFNRFQVKKKSALVLEEKNKLIEEKSHELQIKNEEIISSIRYAERIQKAVLPFQSELKENTIDYSLLFRPKDIVSGDYYWFAKNNEYLYFSVADCTGHGVPGSMLSMIGTMLLNEAIQKGCVYPSEILTYLDTNFRKSLIDTSHDENINDGMDLAIVLFNKSTRELFISTAGRPVLILIENKIEEVKQSSKGIGSKRAVNFEDFKLKSDAELKVILYSDGLTDQSNAERKKFGSNKLKELVESNSKANIVEICNAIENKLDEHQLQTEQRDDITLLGITL
jgi:serine phosphatase RsbU (regulator of sigma subunit)/Tfp pilus assembly protein PilF